LSKKKPRHHEIPKYYLKGFCAQSSPFLWVFERGKPFAPGDKSGKNNPVQKSVSRTALRNDGYAIPVPNQQPDYSYETRLQKEENKAHDVIEKIRKRKPVDMSDKKVIARYIGMMRKRLERRDIVARQILDAQINSLPWDYWQRELAFRGKFDRALEVAKAKESLFSEDAKTTLLRESMVLPYKMSETVLLDMTWNFLVAAKDEYFVTSDNPIIYDENRGLSKSPLIFPISQHVMLFSQWSQGEDLSYKTIYAEETRKFNTVIIGCAIKEIYSPKPDQWIHQCMQSAKGE